MAEVLTNAFPSPARCRSTVGLEGRIKPAEVKYIYDEDREVFLSG